MEFDQAFQIVATHEGRSKIAENSKDPGGLTKWGISLRSHPELGRAGILALTEDKARAIYRADYWDRIRAEDMPELIRLPAFDSGVNLGTNQFALHLQRSLCEAGFPVATDGKIGPQTLRALSRSDPLETATLVLWRRLNFYRSLSTYNEFGKGWDRRVLKVALQS